MKLFVAFALFAVAAAVQDGKTNPQSKAPKKSRIVSPLVVSIHTDEWCHSHHSGVGDAACRKHNGCCYSKVVDKMFKKKNSDARFMTDKVKKDALLDALALHGPCHSCDQHSHDWCDFYGNKDTKTCISLSMCTWNVKKMNKHTNKKGACESKITMAMLPPDIGQQCNLNMGDARDKDYNTWKRCIAQSKKAPGGKLCHRKPGNKEGPKTKKRIKGAIWMPKKRMCKGWKKCKRNTNEIADDRCPDGYQFLWEFPSNKGKNKNRLGVHKHGCRELYSYKARCVPKMSKGKRVGWSTKYKAYQQDEDNVGFDGYFCVDPEGHEISSTRRMRPVELFDINCNIQRQRHKGMQCPNAITFTTRGGQVFVNKRNGKKRDCKVHCNSDTDCKGKRWCCFNGCGYKCKTPVEPRAGCQESPAGKHLRDWKVTGLARKGRKTRHGIEVEVKCRPGYAQVPKKRLAKKMPRQSIVVKCHHGKWMYCKKGKDCNPDFAKKLVCKKDCPPFLLASETVYRKNKRTKKMEKLKILATVPSARTGRDLYDSARIVRNRDYFVAKRTGAGNGRHHGATRTLVCPPGYGPVQHGKFLGKSRPGQKKRKSARSLHIVRHGYETLKCGGSEAGKWDARHLECSVCYDAYEWAWRDRNGNSCMFYRSRPLKCHETGSQMLPPGFLRDRSTCGVWSQEWANVGQKLLNIGQIDANIFRIYYKPWGSNSRSTRYNKGDPRPCACLPHLQPHFSAKLANSKYSPPKTCGKVVKGKYTTIDPLTKKKFVAPMKGYFKTKTYGFGSAVDNCRVACRSCEKAEEKYLQRTGYKFSEFKELVELNKIKKANVGKQFGGSAKGKGKWRKVRRRVLKWVPRTISKITVRTVSRSYPVSQVCTDGKGKNFLKCGVIKNDKRDICKNPKALQKNGCKKGFKPMTK